MRGAVAPPVSLQPLAKFRQWVCGSVLREVGAGQGCLRNQVNVLTRPARVVRSWVPCPCVGTQGGPGLVHRMDSTDSSKTSLFGLNAWIQTVPEPQPRRRGRAGEHGPVPAGEVGGGGGRRGAAPRARAGAGGARASVPQPPRRPRSLRGPGPAAGPGQLLCNRRLCRRGAEARREPIGGAAWAAPPRPFPPGLGEPRQPKLTERFPLPGRAGVGGGAGTNKGGVPAPTAGRGSTRGP